MRKSLRLAGACALALGINTSVAAQALGSRLLPVTQIGPIFGRTNTPIATQIEVFTNSAIYLTHTAGATVYVLDGLQQLEAQLSQGLPNDPQKAAAIAQERLKRVGAAELQRRAANAAQGIVRAQEYGVDRAPAMVFNGRAVVYGVTDVEEASEIYRQHRATALRRAPVRSLDQAGR